VLGFNDGPHLLQCMLQIVFSGVADVQVGLGQRCHHVRGHAPFDEADIQMQSGLGLGQRVQRKHLVRQGGNRAGALLRIDPGMGGHTLDFKVDAVRALALVDDIATDAAGFGIEHGACTLRDFADASAAGGGADFFIAGKEQLHRGRVAPEARQGLQHKHVHHQAGLHVGHAGAVGPAGFDTERALRRRATREDRVHVPHQLQMACGCGVVAGDTGQQAFAPAWLRQGLDGNAGGLQACAQQCGHALYAFDIAAAAVGVHHLLQQRLHGAGLFGQPLQRGRCGVGGGFGGGGG